MKAVRNFCQTGVKWDENQKLYVEKVVIWKPSPSFQSKFLGSDTHFLGV